MYQFKVNKYLKYYNKLIESRRCLARYRGDGNYYDSHHIIPKSLGGANSKLNLILLTHREHFIAHLLLVRIVQDCDVYRMVNAIRRFKKKVSTSREFALLRNTIARYSIGNLNPSYGKIWVHNIQTLEISYVYQDEFARLGENFKKGLPYQRGGHHGRIIINNSIIESYIKKEDLSKFLENGWIQGRLAPCDVTHMRKMSSRRHTVEKDAEHSSRMSGKNHFNYGKPSFVKGRIWINNNLISKMIAPDLLNNYINQGWVKGRLRP